MCCCVSCEGLPLTSLMMMVPSMASLRSSRVQRTRVRTRCMRSISCRRKIVMEDKELIFCRRAFTCRGQGNSMRTCPMGVPFFIFLHTESVWCVRAHVHVCTVCMHVCVLVCILVMFTDDVLRAGVWVVGLMQE